MTGVDPGGTRSRFRELDGLRGIAALAVVVGHLTYAYNDTVLGARGTPAFRFTYGAFGVQLFFLISGYVILMSAQRAKRPSDFVISRVSRLYPTYWVGLAITLVIVTLWPRMESVSIEEALANLIMVQRWFLIENVDPVYWTLAVEMQFYVGVLLLLYLTRCNLTTKVIRPTLILWVAIAGVVAVIAGPHTRGIDPILVAAPYKLLLNGVLAEYAPLFATGCLALLWRRGEVSKWWPISFAVAATAIARVLHDPAYALAVGIIAVVFLSVIARRATPLLTVPPVAWLGKVSYSLYVCHSAAGFLVIHYLEPLIGRDAAAVAALVAVLALAGLVHRVGEVEGTRWLKTSLLRLRASIDARRSSPSPT